MSGWKDLLEEGGVTGPEQPMQPVVFAETGIARFQPNAICQWIIDQGKTNMNELAIAAHEHGWSLQDRMQFAMLIGYSVDGFASLSYATDEVVDAAGAEVERLLEEKS